MTRVRLGNQVYQIRQKVLPCHMPQHRLWPYPAMPITPGLRFRDVEVLAWNPIRVYGHNDGIKAEFLLRSASGRYLHLVVYNKFTDRLCYDLDPDIAIKLYSEMEYHCVPVAEAFPEAEVLS